MKKSMSRKMVKINKIAILLVLVLFLAILAACKKSDDGGTGDNQTPPAFGISITGGSVSIKDQEISDSFLVSTEGLPNGVVLNYDWTVDNVGNISILSSNEVGTRLKGYNDTPNDVVVVLSVSVWAKDSNLYQATASTTITVLGKTVRQVEIQTVADKLEVGEVVDLQAELDIPLQAMLYWLWSAEPAGIVMFDNEKQQNPKIEALRPGRVVITAKASSSGIQIQEDSIETEVVQTDIYKHVITITRLDDNRKLILTSKTARYDQEQQFADFQELYDALGDIDHKTLLENWGLKGWITKGQIDDQNSDSQPEETGVIINEDDYEGEVLQLYKDTQNGGRIVAMFTNDQEVIEKAFFALPSEDSDYGYETSLMEYMHTLTIIGGDGHKLVLQSLEANPSKIKKFAKINDLIEALGAEIDMPIPLEDLGFDGVYYSKNSTTPSPLDSLDRGPNSRVEAVYNGKMVENWWASDKYEYTVSAWLD